ncbi:MAG: hypothetical protein ABFD07_17285 [Methanobacterium sp.]
MRLFHMIRLEDVSNNSGTGLVAQGCIFDDGTVTMRWLSRNRSTVVFNSMAVLKKIHCHKGKTIIEYVSENFNGGD